MKQEILVDDLLFNPTLSLETQDSYFFHFSECPDQLDVGDKVEFDLVKGEKGMNAVNINKL